MSASLAHFQLAKAGKRVESALEELYTHMGYVAEAELEALSRRFPKRRIEFHSGMGSTFIHINKRHAQGDYSEFSYAGALAWNNWPAWLEVPAPDLWSAINLVQDLTDGKDPGVGSIIYENGKRVQGL